MTETTKLDLRCYDYQTDGEMPVRSFLDDSSENLQKVDNAYKTIDTSLSLSDHPADAKTVGDKYSGYMLKSVYDPENKASDMYTALRKVIMGMNAYFIKVTTTNTSLIGKTVYASNSLESVSAEIESDGTCRIACSYPNQTYSITCESQSSSATTGPYFGIYPVSL